MLEKKKKKSYNIVKQQPSDEIEQEWVECIVCGFRGSLDEFLSDGDDSKCPKCGEDIQIFNL